LSAVDLLVLGFDEVEDFAGDVAFQAAHDLEFRHALSSSFLDVFFRPGVHPPTTSDNHVQGAVSGPVASAVESVACGFARRQHAGMIIILRGIRPCISLGAIHFGGADSVEFDSELAGCCGSDAKVAIHVAIADHFWSMDPEIVGRRTAPWKSGGFGVERLLERA
jgi:hypothetical protein